MPKKRERRSAKKRRFGALSITSFFPQTRSKKTRERKTGVKKTSTAAGRPQILARNWQASHYVAILLMASSLALLSLLFTDAGFGVTQLTVSDNRYLATEQILEQAQVNHANIFGIDPQQVALRLKTMLPQLKAVHVRLGIPNQIEIRVEEREPVMIYGHDGQGYWVDAEGHIFPTTTQRNDLPILIDEDGSAQGESGLLDPTLWKTIRQISSTMPETQEFHYRQVYGLFFISPEGWRVYLGEPENIEAKLSLWQTLHHQILQENRAVQVVDLRYDRVYIQ